MDLSILETLGQVAGVAGITIGAFLFVARDLIAKNIFPTLTKAHSTKVILTLAFMAWTVALAGIGAWAYVEVNKNGKEKLTDSTAKSSKKSVLNNGEAVFSSNYLSVGNDNLTISDDRKTLIKSNSSSSNYIGTQRFKKFYGMLWVPSEHLLFVSGVLLGDKVDTVLKVRGTGGKGDDMFRDHIIGYQNLNIIKLIYTDHLILKSSNGKTYHMNSKKMKGICGTGENMCALKNKVECESAYGYDYFDYCE